MYKLKYHKPPTARNGCFMFDETGECYEDHNTYQVVHFGIYLEAECTNERNL